MLISLLVASQAAAIGLPPVNIVGTDAGYRAEVAAFPATQEAAIHAEIVRRGEDLCRGKQVKMGKFGSLTKLEKQPTPMPATISGYSLEFRCVLSEPASYAALPADWQPSAQDEADVRRVFETYYAKRDAGEFDAAAAMFEPGVQEEPPSSEQQREFNRTLGAGRRRVAAVTWYVNRPDAPRPGAYIALDFIGDYPSLHIYCGYLMLYRAGPTRYEITREEQNIVQRGDATADRDQIAAMRAALCRGG